MAWTSSLFFAVILTSVTGSMFQLFWHLSQEILFKRDAKVTYICLRVVMIFYMVPFGYLVLLRKQKEYGSGSLQIDIMDGLFEITPFILKGFYYVAMVWFMASIYLLISRIFEISKLDTLRASNGTVTSKKIKREMENVCHTLHIKRKIRLCDNPRVAVPMLTGILSPEVILPYDCHNQKQLQIILTHELTHYKNQDLLFKMISILIINVYGFNPMAFLLLKNVNTWSEMNCDVDACENGREYFTVREYFDEIVSSALGSAGNDTFLAASFVGKRSVLERRIEQMIHYQKFGRMGRKVALASIAVFVLTSSITTFAAGAAITKAYEKVWDATRVDIDETMNVIEVNDSYQEFRDHIRNKDTSNMLVDEYDWDSTRAIVRPIDWILPSTSFMRTQNFRIEEGETISFTVGVEPRDKDIRMGIVEPNGVMRFIHGTNNLSYTFTINVTGGHKFYAENTSDASVHIQGSMVRSN